jgi:hypothetical protein
MNVKNFLNVAEIKRLSRQMLSIKKEINYMHSHRQQPELINHANEIKSVNERFITVIPEHLCQPLVQVVYKLQLYSTLKELTPQEQ